MLDVDFASAQTLKEAIDKITAVQAKHAIAGARVQILITNANGTTEHVAYPTLASVLGAAYDAICATALTSLNTQLASLKTTKQTAFTAL